MKPPKPRIVSSITVAEFFERHREKLELEMVCSSNGLDRKIQQPAINRPGLALAGFFSYFPKKRVQIIGNSEQAYLAKMAPEVREQRFRRLCEKDIPCLIVARAGELDKRLIDVAREAGVPVISSPKVTMKFINAATIKLETDFAATISLHGCMMDYRGIGVLVMGKSGSGKSETAIGLLERGGALVADDLVRVRKIGDELVTASPEASRGYIEMRGIGIINVANLYGLGAIRPEKRLDLVVTLTSQADLNEVDRVGITREGFDVLGIEVPHVEIPVAPGRDTARLIAVAALELQLRRLGYDMADEFNQRLIQRMQNDRPIL